MAYLHFYLFDKVLYKFVSFYFIFLCINILYTYIYKKTVIHNLHSWFILYLITLWNFKTVPKNLNLKYLSFIFNKACFKTLDIIVLFINMTAIKRIIDFYWY